MESVTVRPGDEWPGGISDGLTLECPYCDRVPEFDYHVDNDFWAAVVPHTNEMHLGVVCLPCLDRAATLLGMDVSGHIQFVQFTGIGKTVELVPVRVVRYAHTSASEAGSLQDDLPEGGR